MKKLVYQTLCIPLLLGSLFFSRAAAEDLSRVLVIHSYHKGFIWTDGVDAAIRDEFSRGQDVQVMSEFLDTKRRPLEVMAPIFHRFLEEKYSHDPPDAIIVSDNNALIFMQSVHRDLFGNVPLFFCGINNFHPQMLEKLGPRVTGVVEKTDPAGTIRLILHLQPDLERLIVVTGMSATAREIKKETEPILSGFQQEVIWKDRLSSRELFPFLETLGRKDAVLLIAFNQDSDGTFYSYQMGARLISSRSRAPVYGLWDHYLNTGVVGGNMVNARDQGRTVARQCLDLLNTGRISAIHEQSPNTILVDYQALRHHGFKSSDLPAQAVVINQPPSFYQSHKLLIWSACVFILVLILLVVTLAGNIVRRRESEQKYRNLFELSMDAIFLINMDLEILDCNPAALTLFCIDTKEDFLLLNPADISPEFQPDGKPSFEKAVKLVNMVMESKARYFEWRHCKSTGQEFDASVLLSRMNIGGKNFVQATVRDISDQKRAQEMLIQSEKMMSVGGLAAGMAHEINNPLAGMLQSATVLTNRLTRPDMPVNIEAALESGTTMEAIAAFMARRQVPKILEAIKTSGARIAAIVENMLSFARKGDSSFSTHNPVELMENVLTLAATDFDLKKHYDFKNITIQKEYGRDLPQILCEAGKIQQVLLNILKNGAQAMFEQAGKNPPEFVIRICHEPAAQMLRIEIQDNGPGMDKETAKRIFEPFFTTKPIGLGTGLGLSISYFIITENHGGTLAVYSQPGKGANFVIRLPLETSFHDQTPA
ncbi:ATP-binding protein [Desulfospira joergensenii]|uniref:ATP-binding protein n=1 Tax=Desulfospira joergensenii TaxID=53329 RepID=UPI0003B70FE5|nr:ATP-binding protein [Desulfospira joergensenii]